MTQGKERLVGATHPPRGTPATAFSPAWEPAEGIRAASAL